MKGNIKTIILYVALIVAVIVVAAWMFGGGNAEKPTYGEVLELFYDNKVSEFKVSNKNVLTIKTTDDKVVAITLRDLYLFRSDIDDYLKNQMSLPKDQRTLKNYNFEEPVQTSWIVSLIPYLIVIIIVIALWVYMMNKAADGGIGKMNAFGKARVKLGRDEKNRVHFSDVAGAEEEKEELREVVDFLRDPDKFRKLGARIPRGVLLVGPPGTGKTLLAKAVAGEAGVPFFSISGSDFVEMYVGVGASRVRDLFETAKKAPASIIFIDEIDAVGRHRGAGLGGGHDEREQTLNQLLVEMDGFGSHDGVIVMAATNRPDILDPALLRPGRFDRQVTVGYPDINGREEILGVHSKGKPFEADVDMKRIAQLTVGFTGADLANLLNEAALLAARKSKSLIGMNDIEESMIKIAVGTQKKSRKIKEEDKRKTAYHEAGHAILAYELKSQDPVRQISIIPSGRALGYTLNPPVEDKYSVYKNELKEEIAMLLGGRAAEEIVYNDVSGGASNDIMRASQIARQMVTNYGMSEKLGTIRFGSDHDSDEVFLGRDFSAGKNYSEETAAVIDGEVKRIIDEAYENAKKVLSEHRAKLDFVAEFLVKNEVMDDEQFKAAMETDTSMEQLEEMSAARRKKSEEENEAAKAASEARRKREEAERKKREDEERKHREDQQKRGDPFSFGN